MGSNTPPQAVVVKPVAGREFVENESVSCVGYGLDLDDGVVTNMSWALGAGAGSGPTCTVTAAVAAGVRSVTATAIDSEGGSKTGSVSVTILAAGNGGLPQTWEQSYWPVGPSGGGTNDPDQDGLNNWDEWLAGSNPTNPASVFRVTAPGLISGSPRLVLQWPSVTNREYTVLTSSNLMSGFTPLTNVMASPPVNVYTTPPSVYPESFYTIQVGR